MDLTEQFLKFHEENPDVYKLFERFAFEAIASGRKHFGAGAITERIRWYTQIETKGCNYKICNNHRAFYARMFELYNPQHEGFFTKRESVADSADLFHVKQFIERSDKRFYANTKVNKGDLIEQAKAGA